MNRAAATLGVAACCVCAGCGAFDRGHSTPQPVTSPASSPSGAVIVPVTAVVDGDTFRVELDGRSARVRIVGINAPELAHAGYPQQCGGEAARTALDRMIWRHDVELRTDPRTDNTDRYGRLLRYVSINGHDVGLSMIQQGRASEYHPRSAHAPARTSSYRAAEDQAQKADRGQWATCSKSDETKQ